jgi:hypothetical protein
VFDFTKTDVLNALPPVLRRVAYNLDYTEEACQELWELGRVDSRPLNQYPDHAIRILSDLAGYEYGKPAIVSERVLNSAERWLDDPNLPNYQHSPLDVIDELLAKQASFQRVEGHSLRLGSVPLNFKAIDELRTRALACVEKCLANPHPRVAKRALESLHKIIAPPVVLYGRHIGPDEYQQWNSERLAGTELLKGFVQRTRNPALLANAQHKFEWLAEHGNPPEIANAVRDALSQIPDSLDVRMVRALTQALFDIGRGDVQNYERLQREFLTELAKDFLAHFEGDPAVSKLEEIVEEIHTAGIESGHGQLFFAIAKDGPDVGLTLVDHVINHPNCPLAGYTASFIQAVRLTNPPSGLACIKHMVQSGRKDLQGGVAFAYAWSDWLNSPCEEDFELLRELLASGDARTKYHAMCAIRRLKDALPTGHGRQEIEEEKIKFYERGINLLLEVDIGTDPNLAEGLCEALDPQFGISPLLLTADQVRTLLNKLVPTREISHQAYHQSKVLELFAARMPQLVFDFLMDRITFAVNQGQDRGNFNPIPFGLEGLFASIEGTPLQLEILRKIRDDLLTATGLKAYWLTGLFKMVAGGFGEATITVISELEQEPNEAKYKLIAILLGDAPNGFIFGRKEFCAGLLERAGSQSQDSYRRIVSALAASEESGAFRGIPGEPSPKYAAICEKATALATEFKARPLVAEFFQKLARSARDTIERMLERDEETFLE